MHAPASSGSVDTEGPRAPRRRYLTILFSDLSDSTRLAVAMEAEHYAEMLADLRQRWEAEVPRHGGTILRIQGDGLLAIFGHPDTQEDDARRATEAALDLHARVRELHSTTWPMPPGGLGMHSGIHSGLVLLQDGDLVLGRFELTGNAANIASRLSSAAARDEILASQESLGPQRAFFVTGPAQTLTLKGIDEPITVHAIVGRAAVQTRFEARAQRGVVPFIGREGPLAMLKCRLGEAMAGRTRFVALQAPAGLGKTRLSDEFLRLASARGCQVHRGYCESYLSAEPLQPVLQMLRSLFGVAMDTPAGEASDLLTRALAAIDPALQVHAATWQRALSLAAVPAHPAPGASAPRQAPGVDNLAASLRELFTALAARRPLVLFIDDWQWADNATRQVIGAVRALREQPLLLLVATRSFDVGDASMSDAEVIDLAPLSDDEAARTIARLLPRSDPFVVAEIGRYSGGNPLFIEELCHSAANDDLDRKLVRMHGGASQISGLIESRLARLPELQGDLVRAAAVIGNVIPTWLLEQITGIGEDDDALRGLAEQDFIYPGEIAGTLRFKHGITRDVIYESVGLHQRRALHLRIAESLQAHATATGQEVAHEALAFHYQAGERPAAAARHAAVAGDKAVASSALDRAKSQYRAALAALDMLPPSAAFYADWAEVSGKLALVCVFDASRADLATFRRAVSLAMESGNHRALARAQYWLGYISYSLGDPRNAIFHCELALAAARHVGDEPLAVQTRATLGQAKTAAADYDAALVLLDEAIAIKRRHRSGVRVAVGLAFSLVNRAWVIGDRGDFMAARECLDDALALVLGLKHEIRASIQGWRSALLLWQGDWQAALEAADDSTHIAEDTRSLFQFCMGRAMSGYARWMLAPGPEPLQTLVDATTWLAPRDGGLFKSFNHGWLADALVASGRDGEARHHVAAAVRRSRQLDCIGVAMAYRAMALSHARAGRPLLAQRYLGQARAIAARRQSAHEVAVTDWCEAGILLRRGERQRGIELLDRALPAFERMGMHWHFAQAATLLAAS